MNYRFTPLLLIAALSFAAPVWADHDEDAPEAQTPRDLINLPVQTESTASACSTLIFASGVDAEVRRVMSEDEQVRFVQTFYADHGLLTLQALYFAVGYVGEQHGKYAARTLTRQPKESSREIIDVLIQVFDPSGVKVSDETESGFSVSKKRKERLEQAGWSSKRLREALKKRKSEYKLDGQAIEEGEKLSTLLREDRSFRAGFEKLLAAVLPILAIQPKQIALRKVDPPFLSERDEDLTDVCVAVPLPSAGKVVNEAFNYGLGFWITGQILSCSGMMPAHWVFYATVGGAIYGAAKPLIGYASRRVQQRERVANLPANDDESERLLSDLRVDPSLIPPTLVNPTRTQLRIMQRREEKTPTLEMPVVEFDPSLPYRSLLQDWAAAETIEWTTASKTETDRALRQSVQSVETLSQIYHSVTTRMTLVRERLFASAANAAERNLGALIQALEAGRKPKRSEVLAVLSSLRPSVFKEMSGMDDYIDGLQEDLAGVRREAAAALTGLDAPLKAFSERQRTSQDGLHEMEKVVEAQRMLETVKENARLIERALAECARVARERRKLFDELQHLLGGRLDGEEGLQDHEIEVLRSVHAVFVPQKTERP